MNVDRLGTEDQLMLVASRKWPQDIGALVLLDGAPLFDDTHRFRIEAVRDVVASRLHLVPRFRQVIHFPPRWLGAPLWVDDPGFDLVRHVRELRLEPPAGDAELLRAVEELRREPLSPSRPPWEMWFLTGLPDSRVALFVKIHHSAADGLAAMTIVTAFMDATADALPGSARPWRPAPLPSRARLMADRLERYLRSVGRAVAPLLRPGRLLRQLRDAWPATRELLAEAPGSKTSVDRVIGRDRELALVRASYDVVRRVARASDATPNDVLLAVTAGGLRRLIISRGEEVEGVTLRVFVPVSLRRSFRGPQRGVNLAQMVVPLALGEADPVSRLRAVAAETTARKARARPAVAKLFRGRLTTRLLLKAVIGQRINLTSASIPGPKRPRWLAGSRVLEVFPVLALMGNQPLGAGAMSYAGTFGIGITADRDAFPDFEVLSAGVRAELDALIAIDPGRRSGEAAVPSGSGRRRQLR